MVLGPQRQGDLALDDEGKLLTGMGVGVLSAWPAGRSVIGMAARATMPPTPGTFNASTSAFDHPLLRAGRSATRRTSPPSHRRGREEVYAKLVSDRGRDLLHRTYPDGETLRLDLRHEAGREAGLPGASVRSDIPAKSPKATDMLAYGVLLEEWRHSRAGVSRKPLGDVGLG